MGPYTRQLLDEQRAADMTSGVHIVGPRETANRPRSELARHFRETVGALYGRLQLGDEYAIGSIEEQGVEALAALLHDVRVALASPGGPTALALADALRRYENDRTGGRCD
jgi:hypothetical protein